MKYIEKIGSRLECSPSLFIVAGVALFLILLARFWSTVAPAAIFTTLGVIAVVACIVFVLTARLIWSWRTERAPKATPAPVAKPEPATVASDDAIALSREADALADEGLRLLGTADGIITESRS